jgi:Histidine kinase-, DNA gyrase B-, and HSP90-like ATPase
MDKQTKPIIGKFVIENLTVGMYDDPRCIYREYVQNSADSIDKAITTNIVSKSEASIYIQINEERRIIEFEDNGTGISQRQVAPLLQNVAQSNKTIGKEKGFRGIGRLGGLAYCDQLIFETSFKGESVKSVMTWNAKKLKEIISNHSEKEEAADVISSVTQLSREPEEVTAHYFKVKLVGVTNNELLHESNIKEYLRMVAPVAFDSHFTFRKKIYEELEKDGLHIDEYNVYVNGEAIYKGYTTQLYDENNGKRSKIGEVKDIQFFKEYDKAGRLLYWGWHSISNIQNVRLKRVNKARGLRLRKDNIQIGDEDRLASLFRDSRFNFYVVGEVYTPHPDLIPNGRRDDFEDSPIFIEFKEKLKPICNEIQKISYDSSQISNAKKDLDELQNFQIILEEKQKEGVIDREEVLKLEEQLEQKREKALKGERTLNKFKEKIEENGDTLLGKVFKNVVKKGIPKVAELDISFDEKNLVYRTDKLSKLSKAEKKVLSRVFGIIKNVLSNDLAENLIQKIEEDFK